MYLLKLCRGFFCPLLLIFFFVLVAFLPQAPVNFHNGSRCLVAEGHSGVTRAPRGQPGQRHHGQHTAWHRTPAPPLHDGPQWQQHQAHHAAHRSPGPLPRPQLPAEEIHRLRAGNHWLCVSGPSVPDGERLFCSLFQCFGLSWRMTPQVMQLVEERCAISLSSQIRRAIKWVKKFYTWVQWIFFLFAVKFLL